MVISCSSYDCTNRRQKGSSIQFHQFPLNRPNILKKWVHAMKRKNFTPTKYSYLCSEHFGPNDYQIRPGADIKLLLEYAVPSIFKGFPTHLQKKKNCRRQLVRINESSNKSIQCNIEIPKEKHLRNKIKILQQRLKRRDTKIKSLKDNKYCSLIINIKKNIPSSDKVTMMLEEQFGGLPLALIVHERKAKTAKKKGTRYYTEMKEFAKTLYFYSPRAYKYVRTLFLLPHHSTIRSWISSMKCEPGEFSQNLQLIWESDKGKYAGNVEIGFGESSELATEVLVIMIVSLTKQFKCPVGFFYVNKIDSSILSTLLSTAIMKLHEISIKVWNVTCDGASANVQCFKKLGCNFDINSLNTKFSIQNSLEVYATFDACHMLKLARSALADKRLFQSDNGDIKWSYIYLLNTFQNDLGLKFANKLTAQHINYRNSVMKFKLAAQTLSSGVADAIDYLCQKDESSFQNSEETVYFIRQIDRLFDILNSRIPFSKGYKSPIHPGNINTIKSVFSDTTNYLKTQKFNGIPLILSGRKMFLIGFIVTVMSTLEIAYKLLGRAQSPLKYILTYKMSQDHLELFFGCIRSRGGSNNNPNCIQCIIKSDNLDETEIDNYLDVLSSIELIGYTNEILDYIAGYIFKSICIKVVCPYCIDLSLKDDQTEHSYVKGTNFTSFVNRGKLKIVSLAVSNIIQELEKSFQVVIVINKKLHNNVKQNIVMLTKTNILNKSTLFFSPNSHPVNVDIGSPSHEYSLFTALSQSFVNIRMRHYAKEINSKQIKSLSLKIIPNNLYIIKK
ncbi:hypothetical protein AGLY_016417 [Aphis glycines]|uniref:THAP-type domain-containing protein n=1 Tax=Aphis glycines TaxID=307491 RepID=A0A6G0SZ02_APHGL|nr:hypothetical protein AGLY_016417 [Aphis glycines]